MGAACACSASRHPVHLLAHSYQKAAFHCSCRDIRGCVAVLWMVAIADRSGGKQLWDLNSRHSKQS